MRPDPCAFSKAAYIELHRRRLSEEADRAIAEAEALPEEWRSGMWTKPAYLAQLRQRFADRSAGNLMDVRSFEREWERANREAYTLTPARYAKGKTLIRAPSKDGYETRAGRLADALSHGRYTHREGGYVVGPRTAERFVRLYAEGWDASPITGELRQPLEPT